MTSNSDLKDKNDSRKILIALTVLISILTLSVILLSPSFMEIISTGFSPGIDLKESAVISFFVTLILLTILTVVSGDGLLGEVQFVLIAFFVFFIIIWLMTAWIF